MFTIYVVIVRGLTLPIVSLPPSFPYRKIYFSGYSEFWVNGILLSKYVDIHTYICWYIQQICWYSGFTLNKGEFRDAISLRYDKTLRGLPSKCSCGQVYNVTHVLNCKKGGFVIIRHNNVRDFEANLLRKVCNDVETEPKLQPLTGEQTSGLTGDEARPDIRARGIWRPGQNGYFDVRITNLNADSQKHLKSDRIYSKHEREKKGQYNNRIMNVEHGTFTPLIFSTTGGVGPECSMFHKYIADRIAIKTDQRYEKILSSIRVKLSFMVIRSCLMCIRGSRVCNQRVSNKADDLEMACDEARLPYWMFLH